MPDNIYFYIIFLSQIILISFYYPMQIVNRMQNVLEKYPPSEYPKLYLKPVEFYENRQRLYKQINLIIMLFGFLLLFGIIYRDYQMERNLDETIPVIYFMFQTFPLIIMELSGFRYFKLMRKADLRTTRKAVLLPRRLFDFVSPAMVSIAIFFNIATIIYSYILNNYELLGDTLVIILSLSLSNALYAGIIYWNLYGKKQDPYQDGVDRRKQIDATIKSLVSMSIVAAIFLATTLTLNKFAIEILEPIIMSVYLQVIVVIGLGLMLRKLKLENINFEVYKVDSNEETLSNEFITDANLSPKNTIRGLITGLLLGVMFGTLAVLDGGTLNGFAISVGFGFMVGTIIGACIDFRKSSK
jgi:hypothetical protein